MKYTQYEIRQEISDYASRIFNGAIDMIIDYGSDGAFVYAKFPDKVCEYAYICYDDIVAVLEFGQHGRAVRMVEQIYGNSHSFS